MKPETEERLHALNVRFDELIDQLVLFPELQADHESKLIKTAKGLQQTKRKAERESQR